MGIRMTIPSALLALLICPPASGQVLLSVSPDHAEAGTSELPITITADTEVYFTYNTQVFFSPATGITTGAVEPFENELETTIDIPADTPAGMQDVTVLIDGIREYSGQDLFEVTRTQDAEIASVDPASAVAGDSHSLVITGSNTHFDGSSQVEFSGTGIQVDGAGARDSLTLDVNITIAADALRTARDVTVTTGGEVAAGTGLFTVLPPPVDLSPAAGTQGETIASLTITGGPGGYTTSTGVALGQGVTVGSVDAPDGQTLVLGDVVIAEDAPVGFHPLILHDPTEVFEDAFLVEQGPNTQLLSVTPDHGDRGHPGLEVELLGQNTHFDAQEVRVSFQDPQIRETQLNAADAEHMSVVLILSDGTGEGSVDVTVAVGPDSCTNCEEVTRPDGFEITAPGTLDSADPADIDAGASADVSITATDGQFVQDQTTLVLEPPEGVEVTGLNVVDANHLTASIQTTAEASGVARDVRAVTGTEVAVGFGLIDIRNPEILGVTPNAGQPGWDMNVKVLGVDIPFDAATQVTFSGTGITVNSVSFDSAEPDQIAAQISIAADALPGSRDVSVSAQGLEVTLPGAFRVRIPPPPDENGGCSCSAGTPASMLLLVGLLGLVFFRRRIKLRVPPVL
jgi:MYXO-CTERM domain-containing protein